MRSGYTSHGQRSATTTFGRAVVSGPLCLPRDGRRDRDALLSCRAPLSPPGVRDLLRDIAQTSDAEWAAIGRGEAVAKVLATDNREIAVAGAVRIASSSERLVGRYRDIERLKRSAIVLEIGRFASHRDPPTSPLLRSRTTTST